MNELGRRLREAREARDLTLAQVEAATRVRQKFISALETGQYADLPPAIYARGQLRTLAGFLGLDAEEIISLYEQETPAPAPPVPAQILAEPLVRPRRFDPELIAGIVLIGAVVAALIWVFRAYVQPMVAVVPTPTATTVMVVEVPTETPSPTVTETETPAPEISATPTRTPSVTLSPTMTAGGILVTVAISDTSWIRVVVDGEQVFEGAVEAGQTQNWGAKQALSMRVGNAGGIKVTVNGAEQPPLGGPGVVVDRAWVLSPDGSVVSLTPPPIGTLTPAPSP